MSNIQGPQKGDANRAARHRKHKWMAWGLLVFTTGVILLIIQMAFDISKWFDLLASWILLSGIAIVLYGVLLGIRAKKSAESASADPNTLSAPIPGVIERTTEMLKGKDETKAKD